MSYDLTTNDRSSVATKARDDYYNELINAYREKNENFSGRKIEYFRKHRDAKIDFCLITGTGALGGAVAGGVAGAIIGGACGSPGGPPGMVVGGVAGGIVGGIIGGAIGAGVAIVYLRPRYREWCKTEAGIEFAGKISSFLNESNILEHVICPITFMPVVDGVRTPDGQLYEKSEIEAWIKDHGTNPKTREPLNLSDLKEDEQATFESAKALIHFLVEKRPETEVSAPHLMEGYDKLIQDTREALMYVHNTKLAVLQKQWQKGKISHEEFFARSKELVEKYLSS